MKSKLTCVLVMMFSLCGLGLAQQNCNNKCSNNVGASEYLQTAGGTMTGPVVGDENFRSGAFSVTGGFEILDANGSSMQMGNSNSSYGSIFALELPGGANIAIFDGIGGGATFEDDEGNGVTVSKGTVSLQAGGTGSGTGISVGPSGISMYPAMPVYANNEAAKAGGLPAGHLYRTGTDPDLVCVVH